MHEPETVDFSTFLKQYSIRSRHLASVDLASGLEPSAVLDRRGRYQLSIKTTRESQTALESTLGCVRGCVAREACVSPEGIWSRDIMSHLDRSTNLS